jgi:nucleoid DNA-binding protein
MNKSELITKMSELSGLTKVDSIKALDAFIKSVMDAVSSLSWFWHFLRSFKKSFRRL